MQAVAITSGTVEKMSRHQLLQWVNSTLNVQYKKIEDLCSGVAYCQMMDLIFPNVVNIKKMKYNPKLEHEFIYNLKLFQDGFTKLDIDKTVPIDLLMKRKFQDNFEFLQWFKKFFDTYSTGKEILKPPAAQNQLKPIKKELQTLAAGYDAKTRDAKKADLTTPPKNFKANKETPVSPSSILVLYKTRKQLLEQIGVIETERNSYYKKLVNIESILNESLKKEHYVEWCTRALAIMYDECNRGNGDIN